MKYNSWITTLYIELEAFNPFYLDYDQSQSGMVSELGM